LIEISKNSDIQDTAKIIEKNGFIRMSAESERISFNRGYTKDGFADKVYHIHLRYVGDNDELYFRDYLKNHQVDVLYEEGEGKHEWDFWDRYIYRVLEWLPLNDKEEGISSGNVGV